VTEAGTKFLRVQFVERAPQGVDRHQIPDCLQQLRSSRPQVAWAQFLQDYSGLILQVIRLSERDPDQISDCYVFTCDQLSRNGFRRLCQFEANGAATFATWLRAVVRRLFIDWRRKEFGRYRISQSIANLSGFEQAVFRLVYEQRTSRDESLVNLARVYPDTTADRLRKSIEQILRVLTPRQRWLLSSRRATTPASGIRPDQDNVSLLTADAPEPPIWAPDMKPFVAKGQF